MLLASAFAMPCAKPCLEPGCSAKWRDHPPCIFHCAPFVHRESIFRSLLVHLLYLCKVRFTNDIDEIHLAHLLIFIIERLSWCPGSFPQRTAVQQQQCYRYFHDTLLLLHQSAQTECLCLSWPQRELALLIIDHLLEKVLSPEV